MKGEEGGQAESGGLPGLLAVPQMPRLLGIVPAGEAHIRISTFPLVKADFGRFGSSGVIIRGSVWNLIHLESASKYLQVCF